MKKGLINEAFRLQQLAGITPLYEASNTDNNKGLKAIDTFSISDIEINGTMYAEIYGSMDLTVEDAYGEKVSWEITSIDGATLTNGIKIEDKAQLQELLPGILSSEEATAQIDQDAENSIEDFDSPDSYDWDDIDGRGDR